MWNGLTVLGVFVFPFHYLPSARAENIDFPALVHAITEVESGGNPNAVGKAGERGLMQIKSETWREVTQKEFGEHIPFSRAFEPDLNQQVGQAYLEELAGQLTENKDKLNDTFLPILVASYHCGPNCVEAAGYSTRRLPPQAREYVERVLNLHGLYAATDKVLAMETHPFVPFRAFTMAAPN